MSEKHALIIGNSKFDDSILSQLLTPERDAESFATLLNDPHIGEFDGVTLLLNEKNEQIRYKIMRFYQNRSKNDLLLLYFSGHGILDEEGQLHFAAKDTEHDGLSGTAVPVGYLRSEMDRSFSRRQILILDCCYSGAFSRGNKSSLNQNALTKDTLLRDRGYGRVVLTASTATQYAWEGNEILGEYINSLFTHYLLEGLSTGEADTNQDGLIDVDELYYWVYEKMQDVTRKQTPTKYVEDLQGQIFIAKANRVPRKKGIKMSNDTSENTVDHEPFYFRNGKPAKTVSELIELCKLYPHDANYHLYGRHFEPWLTYIGKPELEKATIDLMENQKSEDDKLAAFIKLCQRDDSVIMIDGIAEEIIQKILNESKKKRFTFLLSGRTGVGKSSTINKLLGENVAEVGRYRATTMGVDFYDHEIQGIPYRLIDSPGLSDTSGNSKEYLKQIMDKLKDDDLNIDCLWFVTRLDETRIRDDELNAIKNITEAFGKDIWKFAVIVFTFADKVKPSEFLMDFTERTNILREEIEKQINDSTISTKIPAVAVTNESNKTPDGELWLGELYTTILTRMGGNGKTSFLLATVDRVKVRSSYSGTSSYSSSYDDDEYDYDDEHNDDHQEEDAIVITDRQLDRFQESVKDIWEGIKLDVEKGGEIGKKIAGDTGEKIGKQVGRAVGTVKATIKLFRSVFK